MKAGIDFGTSTSEIAIVDEYGVVTVIPNHLGEIITPSVVHFPENGQPIVGREAKEKALIEPETTFLEIKRNFGGGDTFMTRGKDTNPVEIASHIIRYLVDCTSKHMGEDIDSAVITVPAYFTDSQRKEVMAAGTKAGIQVSRIINEPTAAAMDYGIKNMSNCEHILVYDLGGGTLDVTVLELFEGVVDVKSSCGNNTLGGKDFDEALVDYICGRIKKQSKADATADPRAMMRIKIAAEECKIALSAQENAAIDLPFLLKDRGGNPIGFSENISRASFDEMIRDKIYSTKAQIQTALQDAQLLPQDIDLVLLVGGSTRIPLVCEFLEQEFGFEPKSAVDPDLAVVSGAAIQAGVLSGILQDPLVLTDICPYSLSTEVREQTFFGPGELVCDTIIPRNTTLPASASKVYATVIDDQRDVRVSAYQGESRAPGENYMLNSFLLSGIPKGRAGSQRISIRFEYDLNGILDVTAEILSTGKSASVTVDTAELVKNLDLSKWGEHIDAKNYRKTINRAERLIKLTQNKGTTDLRASLDELKKALVLGWDDSMLQMLKGELEYEIDEIKD